LVTRFKLKDWVFSRQRYWGEPIPIIKCDKCGFIPVPEKDLPVVLPKVKSYTPTDNGESPLAKISKWVNVKCPKCKSEAKRETDTMPNWAGSSWYYLRYVDSKNKKEFASEKNLKYFTPVDWYNGGMEHTTLHLLYSRFWHKFLYDLKLVPTKEPYAKRTSHGMILAENGEKMSKSKGNTVNPDDLVKIYGADTVRLYEMFMGPFDQVVSWNTDSMIGPRRFLERVWRNYFKLDKKVKSSKEFSTILNKTIKKVSEDIEQMHFNTAVSSLMILLGEMDKLEKINIEDYKKLLMKLKLQR
jgi:leucyl-tRNA synthetase